MHRASNSEGTYIYDEKRERWIFQQRFTDATGKGHRKAFASKSRKDLKKKVEKWQENLVFTKENGFQKLTVKQWGEKWLSLIKPSIKIKTYDGYVQVMKAYVYPQMGDIRLSNLKMLVIQDFLNGLLDKLSATTVIGIRRKLITMFTAAENQGLMRGNPAKLTRPPRQTRPKIIALDEEQLRKLLSVAKKGDYIYQGVKERHTPDESIKYLRENYYVAIMIAVASSCRIGELFALSWDDVDFENQKITIEKSLSETSSGTFIGDPKTAASNRTIPLLKESFDLLKNWQKTQTAFAKKWEGLYANTQNLVFTNSAGTPVSLTNFYRRWWEKLLKAADMPQGFTFHGLRHTGATLLLKHGVNVKVVSERLGHSNTSVTMNVYQHVLPDMQDKAIEELHKILEPNLVEGKD